MPLILISGFAGLFLIYGGMAGVGWNMHRMVPLGPVMRAVFMLIVFRPSARQTRRRKQESILTRRKK
jgi:hypothetical protein